MSWSVGVGAEILAAFQSLSAPTPFDAEYAIQHKRLRPQWEPAEPTPEELVAAWYETNQPRRHDRTRDMPAAITHLAATAVEGPTSATIPSRRRKHTGWRKRCTELGELCRSLDKDAARQLVQRYHEQYGIPLPMALVYARVG